ncbi:MAG: DUF805 domain-containing protein [Muribaculaceae bacterium]|nr:DUF805 domain-containing protein [Muribaculaceae bacterium]
MTLQQSVQTCFNKYAAFSGRASRSEYWWFILFTAVVYGVLYGFASMLDSTFLSIIAYLFYLAVIVPSLAVAVRRMHDIGKGGGWIFISLVPLIGSIWYIVLACMPSQPGPNRFGENPDGPTPDSFKY